MECLKNVREQFPQVVHFDKTGKVYLDSSATTLKPQCIQDFLKDFYSHSVSNVHRGQHQLSLELTQSYEDSRACVADFIGATAEEIIFTRGTTEGINFLAESLSNQFKEGDEILLTEMEHHSNLIPWQRLANKKKLKLKFLPVTKELLLDVDKLDLFITDKTKLVSMIHVSNVLGQINPIELIINKAKKNGILTIIDAAQSVSCVPIDVGKLDCDFLVFSGHKLFAPTGIGVLYGKKKHLDTLTPYQQGGGMVSDVNFEDAKWTDVPQRFEAGTPFIEGAICLAKVIEFLKKTTSLDEIKSFEQSLLKKARAELAQIPKVRLISPPSSLNTLSFVIEGVHSSDVCTLLAKQGLFLRSGHHCCLPLMKKLKLPSGTIRASFSIYSHFKDILLLKKGIEKSIRLLGV